ncbi:MAG: hypothetical protein PHF05_05875 [Candidatus Izemoplasmatales bacterium]|nr:hypothetical protein [Candidatus Izemoplasmatales bacterium]
MKSIEIKVPRNLIQKFYPHPEPYGDGSYVVDLINGMYTDVFYREEGDFVTITNDNKLISYLKKNQATSRQYFFRNGVYSLRIKEDIDNQNIDDWNASTPIFIQLEMPKEHNLPDIFMFCFYWIEVGYVTMKDRTMTLRVYEKDLIHMIDIGVAIDLIIESIKNTTN